MTTDGEWLDLRAVPDERWRRVTLPGAEPDVELTRLHVDPDSGASLSLVRFPAGWSRPQDGCYPVGEEIAVLDGSLEVSGVTLRAGDYGWVPPRVLRTGTASPEGALVLAMFTGMPQWLTDPDDAAPGQVLAQPFHLGPLRPAADDVPGWSVVVDEVTEVADADRDLLDVAGACWVLVPAGTVAPVVEGPVQARTWT
jgi:hypothetical protein